MFYWIRSLSNIFAVLLQFDAPTQNYLLDPFGQSFARELLADPTIGFLPVVDAHFPSSTVFADPFATLVFAKHQVGKVVRLGRHRTQDLPQTSPTHLFGTGSMAIVRDQDVKRSIHRVPPTPSTVDHRATCRALQQHPLGFKD